MVAENRDNNVFRYMHFRPAKATGRDSPINARAAPARAPERDRRSSTKPASAKSARTRSPAVIENASGNPDALVSAKRELASLDLASSLTLRQPRNRSRGPPAFLLTGEGVARLSQQARALLQELGTPAETSSYPQMIDALDRALSLAARRPWPRPGQSSHGPEPEPAHLKAVGVADLLLVKQQIKRYEAGEIAHIENLLAGESKTRTHRQLDRTEEVFTTVNERQHEKENELQTTERFELNRETTKTQEDDQKFGFGLTFPASTAPPSNSRAT